MDMPRTVLLKTLYAANRTGSLVGCSHVQLNHFRAMLELKLDNPTSSDEALLMYLGPSANGRCVLRTRCRGATLAFF
jgi:hypothetical protein